jgi:beta-glucosidase
VLVDVIELVHERAAGLPVYITENGAAYPDQVNVDGSIDDEERRRYFELHVNACDQALAKGLPLKGYFAWSLMDNFEWAFGFSRRFGLVYVDYSTQLRTVKKSGRWFQSLLAGLKS